MRSFYLNLEITIALHSSGDCEAVAAILDHYVAGSKAVNVKDYADRNRSKPALFLENLVRLAGPLL